MFCECSTKYIQLCEFIWHSKLTPTPDLALCVDRPFQQWCHPPCITLFPEIKKQVKISNPAQFQRIMSDIQEMEALSNHSVKFAWLEGKPCSPGTNFSHTNPLNISKIETANKLYISMLQTSNEAVLLSFCSFHF